VVDGVALADIATSGGTVTQTLSGLASHHTHTVKLVVSSPGGTTESAVATFTTPYKGPAAGTITVSGVTASDAVVSAFVDTDGAAGTAHYVLDGVARPDIATSGGTITDRLTGLAAGRAHTVKLVVTTPAGTAESALDSFTTPAVVFKPTLTLGIGKGRAAGQLLLSRRTVTLFVRCGNVACQARATGTVTAGRKTLGRLRAPTKPITIAADTRGRLQPTSSAALRRRVRAYLKAHKRAKVTIVLKGTFTGADGTTIVRRITINVRRLKR
jgi:ATP-dependent protease ClpP protease subunit